jgi:2-polyprenyl-6-methoxyphenol hydroxylase-like FAD-dependent oxidoreductase
VPSSFRKGSLDQLRAAGLDAFKTGLVALAPELADRTTELASWDDIKLLSVAVDRLERWWRPGLICIGDAAHAMSPIGGVGINLAIQDAVAAANLLAKPLSERRLEDGDLAAVQKRREWPAKVTQAAQIAIQNRVITPLLARCRGESRVREGGALWYDLERPARVGLPAPIKTLLGRLSGIES